MRKKNTETIAFETPTFLLHNFCYHSLLLGLVKTMNACKFKIGWFWKRKSPSIFELYFVIVNKNENYRLRMDELLIRCSFSAVFLSIGLIWLILLLSLLISGIGTEIRRSNIFAKLHSDICNYQFLFVRCCIVLTLRHVCKLGVCKPQILVWNSTDDMICKIWFATKSIADFWLRTDNSLSFLHPFP